MSKRSRAEPPASELLDAVFGALAHPARRRILVSLHARGGVMTAGEIADRFKHSWPTTTRHLQVLERAGLLEVGKEGRCRLHSLRPDVARRAADWMHAWADDEALDAAAARAEWRDLPYATMRNATPPKPA